MKKIRPGMEIAFRSGDEECLTRVKDVRTYISFEDLLDHDGAVDDHPLDARRELPRLLVGRVRTYPCRVEHDDVGRKPVRQPSALPQPQAVGRG